MSLDLTGLTFSGSSQIKICLCSCIRQFEQWTTAFDENVWPKLWWHEGNSFEKGTRMYISNAYETSRLTILSSICDVDRRSILSHYNITYFTMFSNILENERFWCNWNNLFRIWNCNVNIAILLFTSPINCWQCITLHIVTAWIGSVSCVQLYRHKSCV